MGWLYEYSGWLTFLGAVLAATGAFLASQQNAALSRRLAAQSEEIAALNRQIVGTVTGGDSFGYLHPLFREGRVDYFLRINPAAKYPVYDATVLAYDVTPPLADPRGTLVFGPHQFGTLTGSIQWYPVLSIQPPAPNEQHSRHLRVEIAARNGVLVQDIRLEVRHGAWVSNSRSMLRNGQPVEPPPDFPQERLE